MKENAALRYIQSNVAPPDPTREVNWKDKPLAFKLYRNCEQIPFGHEEARTGAVGIVPCADPVPTDLGLSRGQIGQMLVEIYGLTRQSHSVPIHHPMLKFIPRVETGASSFYTSLLRPVPSGGALFPCELYLLVSENRRDNALRLSAPHEGQHLPAGIYHYDAAHHALDILAQGDFTSLLQSALAHPGDTPPAYTLLLSSYFWKDGFKYGAFSYRLQGLDIGTVISQSEIITHHAGLATTIHYQFQDKVLNDLLDLDPLHESVYAVIEWRPGKGEFDLQKADESSLHGEAGSAQGTGRGQAPSVPTAHASYNPITPTLRSPFPALGSHNPSTLGPHNTLVCGTIDASAFGSNEISYRPETESIARWPLPEEIHRASLIETRETFRPLHTLAPIEPLGCEKTLALGASQPLDLWEARTKRRSTTGNFLSQPLTKQQLSRLLRTSMRGTTNDLDGHTDFLQHTLLYCIVFRVIDIPPGVYRYQPEKHVLELVREGPMPYEFHRALSIPNFFSLFYMSVNLFPVGNYQSGFQAYGDRWYRMQNMEAGIIAQRLYLAAAAQNLGCRASLGFPVSAINRFLGLADAEEDPKKDPKNYQHTSLIQLMIAPERTAYQQYEQSLLI
jgi:SagB-type dehydrogenase family enzyme